MLSKRLRVKHPYFFDALHEAQIGKRQALPVAAVSRHTLFGRFLRLFAAARKRGFGLRIGGDLLPRLTHLRD